MNRINKFPMGIIGLGRIGGSIAKKFWYVFNKYPFTEEIKWFDRWKF